MTRISRALAVYIPLFYAAWACIELLNIPGRWMADGVFLSLVKDGVIKNLLWTVPAMLLVSHFRNDTSVSLKTMFGLRNGWKASLPVFAAFTVYLAGGALLRTGGVAVSPAFDAGQLIAILFAGLTEEMVFRGWLLNAALPKMQPFKAMLLTAVLFWLIHFPIWIFQGVLISTFLDLSGLCVLALGMVFGWLFVKTRNLLIPIALHIYWDLLVTLLY